MQTHEDMDGRGGDPGLTTEDLAHPGAGGAGQAPLYPGEATPGLRDGDDVRGDDVRGDDVRGDDVRGDGVRGDDLRGDDPRGDGVRGDDLRGDDVRGDDVRGGDLRQDGSGGAGPAPGETEPLLDTGEAEQYRTTWSDIQGRFVDDPQDAVRSADTLVAEVMQTLAGTFSTRKQGLQEQWDRGEQVATEDLRLALQQYRSFFNRLLNT
ncbi:hypothetical protein ACGFXC_06560 [Streptomyces sp. NPDC048507]|uniref:hypothetical protein n=1 Tax=Streptomyces sp. NPDC048507 TaxID=3365560 RepID=UPI00371785A9